MTSGKQQSTDALRNEEEVLQDKSNRAALGKLPTTVRLLIPQSPAKGLKAICSRDGRCFGMWPQVTFFVTSGR